MLSHLFIIHLSQLEYNPTRVGAVAISSVALFPSPGTAPEIGVIGKGSGGKEREMVPVLSDDVLVACLDIAVDMPG